MSTTQAQAAVMESTAAKFERVNESLESMLKRLMDELEMLRNQWQGAGGRSFEQVKQSWAKDQAALHRALAETAVAIRTAGKRYHTSDATAADRVNAAQHGHISLPL